MSDTPTVLVTVHNLLKALEGNRVPTELEDGTVAYLRLYTPDEYIDAQRRSHARLGTVPGQDGAPRLVNEAEAKVLTEPLHLDSPSRRRLIYRLLPGVAQSS